MLTIICIYNNHAGHENQKSQVCEEREAKRSDLKEKYLYYFLVQKNYKIRQYTKYRLLQNIVRNKTVFKITEFLAKRPLTEQFLIKFES